MKKYKVAILILITIFFSGCEYMSYKDFELPQYNGMFKWKRVVKNAEWKNRYDHAATAYNKYLWVFGGYNPGQVKGDTYYEDVWKSADGEKWESVLEKAPWHGRRGHSVITFDDGNGEAMYLIGGFSVDEATGYRQYMNDVWKTTDGKNWQNIKERLYPIDLKDSTYLHDWFPRMKHSCVVANHGGTDYIYLLGGYTMLEDIKGRFAMTYFNDVWRSADGIRWDSLPNNDYGIRAEHAATVDPSTGRIYIQGGRHGIIFDPILNSSHPIPDWQGIWSSIDGIYWTVENDTSETGAVLWRSDHKMVHYKNMLWGLPGRSTSNVHYTFSNASYYNLWHINDNGALTIDSPGQAFDARHGYATVLFDDKVWVLGGMASSQGQANDVWVGEL